MGIILVSGTPGTGKTTLASRLAKHMRYRFIDIGRLAEAENIYLRVDSKRNTKIIDEGRLAVRLEQQAKVHKGRLVMSSHYAEIVNPKLVRKVIVLRTHPEELKKRLSERGWSAAKIQENMEAEIVGVCSSNVLARYPRDKIYEIDTTALSAEETLRRAIAIVDSKGESYAIGSISWLNELEKENKLGKYIPIK